MKNNGEESSIIDLSISTNKFCIQLKAGQEIRKYQEELAAPGLRGENYIFVAPTGTGKTLVAARIIADHLDRNQNLDNVVVLLVVPTKALAEQQKDALERYIPGASVEICTGETQQTISLACLTNHVAVCTGGKLYSELFRKDLKFSQLSLMIFDECHSAVRGSDYANVLKLYVEEEITCSSSNPKTQIIGMTASPGAGKNPRMNLQITLDHLKMLAAHMNATSGIKTVVEHTEELERHRKAPKLDRLLLEPRDVSSDPFVQEVLETMKEIEKDLKGFQCVGIKRWSHKYLQKIRQNIHALELSDNESFLDLIRANKELLAYCSTLCVYMNLRSEDAIKVLKKESDSFKIDVTCSESRQKYATIRRSLIERLESLEPHDNPLMSKLQDVLYHKFVNDKNSKGLVFVRTRYEAKAMSDWIADSKRLAMAGIHPGMIVGHTTNKKDSMTQAEQKEVIEQFRNGDINLLMATSVAEEGLDIPACNLVMRYQYIASDIKKEQAEGRARAVNSECYTIISAHSPQKYQDILNEELIRLVQTIFKNGYFPNGDSLAGEIKKLQNKIIDDKRKKEAKQKQKKVLASDQIQLLCKLCKVQACFGSDVRVAGEQPYSQFAVSTPEFAEKYSIKPHHAPAQLTDSIYKTHKIYCKKCGADWGVKCVWSSDNQYPIIKCVQFLFKFGENKFELKKWSNAPFDIPPLEDSD